MGIDRGQNADHLRCRVPQYLLQGEYVTAIYQESGGKGMAAKMGMKPGNTRLLSQS